MTSAKIVDRLDQRLLSREWRLSNLYYIVNKSGIKTLFKPNAIQQSLLRDLHTCNIILKARQLGISTFISILLLDACLFGKDLSAGIIAHTREDAEALFRRIKVAYDSLPAIVKQMIAATTDTARELRFSNGSCIRVGTSMRGSTLQYLHISEFGKICAKYPDKAEEVITGSLNTIAPGQFVFIESTAEGREGYFFDMCKNAQDMQRLGKELSDVDYKFFFFPWYLDPTYRIGSQIIMTQENLEYFEHVRSQGITLDNEQKWWYAAKASVLGDNMMREFPTTPEESFESAIDGSYYSRHVSLARTEHRITRIPYDTTVPVHTAFDLGYNDSTAIWFFQVVGKELHIIEYIEGHGESLAHWLGIVKSKPYVYDKHLAPHDIMVHEYTTGLSRQTSARKMGINLIPVPRHEIIQGIDAVRAIFNRCWFDEAKCINGIKALENYKKEWDDRYGVWKAKPRHDQHSHGADAFRVLACGLPQVQTQKIDGRTLGSVAQRPW